MLAAMRTIFCYLQYVDSQTLTVEQLPMRMKNGKKRHVYLDRDRNIIQSNNLHSYRQMVLPVVNYIFRFVLLPDTLHIFTDITFNL